MLGRYRCHDPELPELTDMNDDGFKRLLFEIMKRAILDFKSALYEYNTIRSQVSKSKRAYTYFECKQFILKNAEDYIGVDGQAIIKAVEKKTEERLWKNKLIEMEVPDERSRIIRI